MTHNGWLPKKSVKGDHVFITGGGSGIGRGMARRFVELGASVTIADLDMDAANKTGNSFIFLSVSSDNRSGWIPREGPGRAV